MNTRPEDRDLFIDGLISRMTIEEKAGQLSQMPNMTDVKPEQVAAGRVGSIICSASAFAGNEKQERVRAGQINELQRVAVEKSRLGIPLLFARDVIHGHRTVAPIPLGQASSFSPEHVRRAAVVAAREAAADGIKWAFTPMLDIARDPRWGRVAEGYGEDPFLASRLAEATIKGLQGESLSDPDSVAACAKHFAGYGSAEGGRDYNVGEITTYTMRNVYLPPFEAAVRAGVASLMSAFNEIGGVPATANRWLLSDVLRKEWGSKAPVISDWNAVAELVCHGRAEDDRAAAKLALLAGVDIDMASDAYIAHLPALIEAGEVPMSSVDEAVRRVLALKFELRLFENPYADPEAANKAMFTKPNQEEVLELARRSIVLLKNRELLPLKGVGKLGVFGPLARATGELFGTWTLDGVAEDAMSIADALKFRVGSEIEVVTAEHVDQAINMARFCDAVVAVVGETPWRSGENNCVTDIGLAPGDLALLQALKRLKVPLVVVVLSGRPLDLSWLEENADAILLAWHPGVMGGIAIAEILAGSVNPSGKLPITLPRSIGQAPIYYNRRATGRPLDPNERGMTRYVDSLDSPLFPFGFGLSYSKFAYSDLRVEGLSFRVQVENQGTVEGEEIVQLYIRDEVSTWVRPVRELKGFQRVSLKPFEALIVKFTLEREALGYYSPEGEWLVEPGWFTAWVGSDSNASLRVRFRID